jgi:uncharacterized membrane protein YbhN (UPF0104 family)
MKRLAMSVSAVRKLRNAAYVLLIAVAIVLVVTWWPVLVGIWQQQALTFVGAVIVMICGTFVQARNFLVFLDDEHSIRSLRFTRVWALSALANYVAPLQPGIAVRVGWLVRRGVDVSEGLLATWRQLVVSVWISMIGLAIGLLLTGDPRGRWPALALGVVWVAVFGLRRLGLRALDRLARPRWLARRKELLQRAATHVTLQGIAGVAVQYLLGTLLLYWIYTRFGASIGWGQALIICCLAYMSSLVAFLPGNLGVVEAIYMLGGHGFGLTVAEAGALAILIRVAHVAANMLLVFAGSVSRKA